MKPSGLLRKSVASKVGADARAVGEGRAPAPQLVAMYAVGDDRSQPSEPAGLTLSLLFRTSQRLQTVLDRCFLTLGTTAQEAAVLLCCANADGISGRGLAEALDKDKGRITRYVDRLVARRLVTRKVDPRNRSLLIIAPTRRGRRLAPRLKNKFDDIRNQLFAEIPPDDVAQLELRLSQLLVAARRLEAKSVAKEDGVAANR
jgi:DNA-binding MarR family transcriptional regulator